MNHIRGYQLDHDGVIFMPFTSSASDTTSTSSSFGRLRPESSFTCWSRFPDDRPTCTVKAQQHGISRLHSIVLKEYIRWRLPRQRPFRSLAKELSTVFRSRRLDNQVREFGSTLLRTDGTRETANVDAAFGIHVGKDKAYSRGSCIDEPSAGWLGQ